LSRPGSVIYHLGDKGEGAEKASQWMHLM
jgi:hypothetical protein